ncbi:MAG: ABC transporter ATP-binding protein/permease [Hydrococcus sp. Prado102]|jgi:ATP-binding cassette subfamily B protein|nr:ABC transporter ATP-binding protein/permease [Hydrococcus sp. Prado102]
MSALLKTPPSEIRRIIKFFFQYIHLFIRSVTLLWIATPTETTFFSITLLLQSAIPGIAIWINKQVVDAVTTTLSLHQESSFWTLISLVAGWATAILLQNLLPPYSEAAFANVKEKLTAYVNFLLLQKADSFKDLMRFEDSYFYDELQLIQEQVVYQPTNLLGTVSIIFRESIAMAIVLILLTPLGWWIPLIILLAFLPQTYFSFQIQWDIWETMSEKSPQARKMQYYSSVMLTDAYAKEVRLFGLGSLFIQRYLEAFEDKYQAMRSLRTKKALVRSILAVSSALANALAFYWVVLQALRGQLSPGNILLFIQSLAYLQENLIQIINSIFAMQETLIFMERLYKFLDSQPTLPIAKPGLPVPLPIRSGITFENISFSYPDGRLALEDISFTLKPGKTVALVGENGSGKTTLIKLLARFYDPTKGKILIDGTELISLELEEWRRQIAVVFQDFCRYSLTIGENIALGNLNSLNNLEELKIAAKKAGIFDKIDSLENKYQTLLGKQFDGTELSGGEWQKVAIARAFIRQKQSQILVLDEPTAALDPRSEYEIYHTFSELVRGKTAILVTHRLASVLMADAILVLKRGKLIEQGTHEELLQQGGEYATLWNMQAKQYDRS